VSAVFFISGAASLIFELVWFHRAGLVFGNSVWAASIVLSSFMGGLAVGSAAAGRYGHRISKPLYAYAALEILVAVSGITLTYVLPGLTYFFVPVGQAIQDNPVLVNVIRLAAAFAALLVPASAMGATLPVLVAGLCRESADGSRAKSALFGRTLGRLYGWNTLGAVAGVLFGEILLVDRLGVSGSAWAAAGLDLVAAGGALVIATRAKESSPSPSGAAAVQRISWTPLMAAFLAGACLLALEIVWFRFLTMYVLATTMAASVMLAVVLTAIGSGAIAASAWQSFRPDAVGALPVVALAAGCSVALSYSGFERLTSGTQIGDWTRIGWLAFVLTFPTAFFSGVLFTLLGEVIVRRRVPGIRAAAWLTVANTTGAMVGPLLVAFLILPALGMERTMMLTAVLYGVIALLVFIALAGEASRRLSWFMAMAAVWAVVLATFPAGSMNDVNFLRAAQAYKSDGSEVVATREGASETIFVMQQKWLGQPVYSRLVTNGFSMSGTAVPALRYMKYFVYWPMILHQQSIRRVLVVCYGVGATASAATDIASAESIDVVEISRDIVNASDAIHPPDRHPLRDPRVRLHIEDGRYFLQTTSERFDLITGEPPPPRTPGAVNIYTREYFQMIHDRLADGGMATYWVPVARPNPGTDVNTIIRAFCDVFEDCSLWNGTPFDLMLAGTRNATGPIAESDFARPWVTPGLESKLRELGFESPQQIGATFLGDSEYLRQLTASAPPLTDNFPQRLRPVPGRPSLSDPNYGADPGVAALYQRVIDPGRAREAFESSPFVRRLWPNDLIAKTRPSFDVQRTLNRVIFEGGNPLRQIEDLHAVLTQTTLRTLPLWILGSDEVKERIAESSTDGGGEVAYTRALRAFSGRGYRIAAEWLIESGRRGFRGQTVRPLLAYALAMEGEKEAASLVARDAAQGTDDEKHFWGWMRATFGMTW
jgi:predicted membrane-bound spermidine synthase